MFLHVTVRIRVEKVSRLERGVQMRDKHCASQQKQESNERCSQATGAEMITGIDSEEGCLTPMRSVRQTKANPNTVI